MRKKIFIIINLCMICGLLFAGCGAEKTPKYSFAQSDKIAIQPEKVDKVNLKDYLPEKSIETIHQTPDGYTIKDLRFKRVDDKNNAIFVTNGTTITYSYDEKNDKIVSVVDIVGKEIRTPVIVQLGSSYENEDNKLSGIPYLFTVTLSTGVYEDCICMLTEHKSDNSATATYYAKGIGEILSMSSKSADAESFVETVYMTKIVYMDGSNNSQNNNEDDDLKKNELANARFVNFDNGETFISFNEDGTQMTVGDEKPVAISYKEAAEGYEAYPSDDAESHIIITINENDELEFVSSGRYGKYCGTYIRGADVGTDGEK